MSNKTKIILQQQNPNPKGKDYVMYPIIMLIDTVAANIHIFMLEKRK